MQDNGSGGYTSTWVVGPTFLNFTLSDETSTYDGTNQALSSYWDANTIFGGSFDSGILGADYVFKYDGSTVTSFKNADVYSGITVNILNDDYKVKGTGNTNGALTIDKAAATVTANSDTRSINIIAEITKSKLPKDIKKHAIKLVHNFMANNEAKDKETLNTPIELLSDQDKFVIKDILVRIVNRGIALPKDVLDNYKIEFLGHKDS